MTLQEFIGVWQAQPFRRFRLHFAESVLDVTYPSAAALLPDLSVIVAQGDTALVPFALEAVQRVEVYGPPQALAEVFAGIAPEALARDAQRLAEAQHAHASSHPAAPHAVRPAADPGRVAFVTQRVADGEWVVHATVARADGSELFRTTETRWNLHGVEPFENGTTLYLHHPADPTREQRVIIWPPDRGSFESFAEGLSLAELRAELVRRDHALTAKPVRPREPTATHFKKIHPEYLPRAVNPMAELFGEEADERDLDRFEFHLVARDLPGGERVHNPCLVDVPGEDFFFNLTETKWDATFVRTEIGFDVGLRYAGVPADEIRLQIDPFDRTAIVAGDGVELPVAFVQRVMLNYALYERWPLMRTRLREGPPAIRKPEIVLPLPEGYQVELWPAEPRYPLPFLQPRVLTPAGETLLDFRATPWAAALHGDAVRPTLALTLISHEKDAARWAQEIPVEIDLVARRVTSPGREGSTSLGMFQGLVRRIRGVKWWREDLAAWLAKGRTVPRPA